MIPSLSGAKLLEIEAGDGGRFLRADGQADEREARPREETLLDLDRLGVDFDQVGRRDLDDATQQRLAEAWNKRSGDLLAKAAWFGAPNFVAPVFDTTSRANSVASVSNNWLG